MDKSIPPFKLDTVGKKIAPPDSQRLSVRSNRVKTGHSLEHV